MFILLFGMTIGATFTGRAPDPALAYSFCRDLDLEYRNAYNDCYGTDVCLCDGNEEKEICVFTAFQACAWHASACASHVHRMCIACASHVHRMCIPCASHVHVRVHLHLHVRVRVHVHVYAVHVHVRVHVLGLGLGLSEPCTAPPAWAWAWAVICVELTCVMGFIR